VSPETLEDFSIGSLDLSITLWMSNKGIADLDAEILAVSMKCAAGELGPIVGDDLVQGLEPIDDGLYKLDYRLLVDLDHRGCFRALGDLVDGNIQIPETSDGPGELRPVACCCCCCRRPSFSCFCFCRCSEQRHLLLGCRPSLPLGQARNAMHTLL
jgi:hypothetical protein